MFQALGEQQHRRYARVESLGIRIPGTSRRKITVQSAPKELRCGGGSAATAALQTAAALATRGHSPATCGHEPRARPSPPAASASASRRETRVVLGVCRVVARPSSYTRVLQNGTGSVQTGVASSAPPAVKSRSPVSPGQVAVLPLERHEQRNDVRAERPGTAGRWKHFPAHLDENPLFNRNSASCVFREAPVAPGDAGDGTAQPLCTGRLQRAMRIIALCDQIINPHNF